MDDFSVFGNSFELYLKNLEQVLNRCEETNLVLSLIEVPFHGEGGYSSRTQDI